MQLQTFLKNLNTKPLFNFFTTKNNQPNSHNNYFLSPSCLQNKLKKIMQKSQLRDSLSTNEKQFYCIRLSFLQQKNFKFMYENALKLNKSYQIFVQTILNYFRAFHEYCSHIRQPTQDKIKFLYYFRRFIYDHSKITSRITDYQIGCLLTIKQVNNEQSLSQALFEVVESAKKYLPFQKEIREKKEVLTKEFTIIKGEYMNLLKKMKKPKYYYDRKLMRGQFQQLKSKISINQKAQQSILSQIITVDTNTTSYFHQIDTFRKQLLKNKYRYHKKFTQLAMNSRQSLAQLFYYQYNCLNDYYQLIMGAMKQEEDRFGMVRAGNRTYRELVNDASGCVAGIVKNTEQFLDLLQGNFYSYIFQVIYYLLNLIGIQNDLKQTEKNFSQISKKLNQNKQKSLNKISYQQINKFFQLDQSPVQAILQTIDVFQYCFRKLAQKQADVKRAAQEIQNIRKQIIKYKGITLSLLKVKLKSNSLQTVRDIDREEIRDQCGVYDFMNSLDLKPVKYLIKQCLDRLLFTFSEILQFFGQHSGSKQKVNMMNSMQLSYIQKPESQIRKKRPVKDELWLWEDYRKRVDTEFTLSKQLFYQINNQYLYYKDNGEIDLQLQKYQCYNQQLQQQGQLCVSKKAIKFVSKNSDKQLTIPISDVEQIKRKKIVIKEWLIIKTKVGELMFRQFQSLSQVQTTLKQIVQTGGAPKAKVQKRPKIELTQVQKAKIQSPSRKQQIQKIRPAITPQFKQIQQKVFQSMPLDEFYDLILSDKKFSLTGKQHDSFLVYAMKKMKNKDFKITSFQPPGPKYYTLDENTTFQNGPLVSECKYEYKHLLDMPFLPSQCANHQSRKIFWVSDKQLDYLIHAQTSGVPLSENFYVEVLYKLRQENDSTILKVYAQIKFLKSFAFQSQAESGTWKEIKEGTSATISQIEKGINLYKTLLSGKAVEQQQQTDTGESDSKKQMQKLKQRNMYLIIAVVVILIINIMWKIFF